MKKILFLLVFAGILFSSCKKEKTPEPTPAPVQKKLMVYAKNMFIATEDLIYITVSKNNGGSDGWTIMTGQTYANEPAYGSEGTLTLDVSAGEKYDVMASCALGDHTWGPATYTINSDRTAVPIN